MFNPCDASRTLWRNVQVNSAKAHFNSPNTRSYALIELRWHTVESSSIKPRIQDHTIYLVRWRVQQVYYYNPSTYLIIKNIYKPWFKYFKLMLHYSSQVFQSSGSNLNMSDVVKIAIKEPTIVALHSGRARHDHFLLILHDSDPGTTPYGTPRAKNPAMVCYHHEEGHHLLQHIKESHKQGWVY